MCVWRRKGDPAGVNAEGMGCAGGWGGGLRGRGWEGGGWGEGGELGVGSRRWRGWVWEHMLRKV